MRLLELTYTQRNSRNVPASKIIVSSDALLSKYTADGVIYAFVRNGDSVDAFILTTTPSEWSDNKVTKPLLSIPITHINGVALPAAKTITLLTSNILYIEPNGWDGADTAAVAAITLIDGAIAYTMTSSSSYADVKTAIYPGDALGGGGGDAYPDLTEDTSVDTGVYSFSIGTDDCALVSNLAIAEGLFLTGVLSASPTLETLVFTGIQTEYGEGIIAAVVLSILIDSAGDIEVFSQLENDGLTLSQGEGSYRVGFIAKDIEGGTVFEANSNGTLFNHGRIINTGTDIVTSGPTATIVRGTRTLLINPESVLAELTVSAGTEGLEDGTETLLIFGGEIASGNTVVSIFAFTPPVGTTLFADSMEAISGNSYLLKRIGDVIYVLAFKSFA